MDLAINGNLLEESAVDDFTIRLFDILGYTTRSIVARPRKDIIELVVCGKSMHAETDVCLMMNRSEIIILLVQEDKRHLEDRGDADAGLLPLEHHLIPGIVMIGTAPVFYKIPVTKELSDSIIYGTFPKTPTVY